MSYGIKLLAVGKYGPLWDPVEWLVSFDPDAHAPNALYPTGSVEADPDPARAMRFETFAEATELILTQSTVCPLRPDGERNLPLMAFTTEVVQIPDRDPEPDEPEDDEPS